MKFDLAIQYVLQNEGGIVNNPADRGGATNFGITQKLLEPVMPGKQVKDLTVEEAKLFYQQIFWNPIKLEQVNNPQATCILDLAVNAGQGTAVKCAQIACGFMPVDGIIGPKTIASINASEPDKWIHDFIVAVKDHYLEIVLKDSTQLVFLKGWLNRALRMILLLEPVKTP